MSKYYRKPSFKVSSGSAIGKRAKKIVGCECCNFAQPHEIKFTPKPTARSPKPKARKYRTSDICPRCENTSIRVFDSKAEYIYGEELKILENTGEIRNVCYQVRFDLHAHNAKDDGSAPEKVTTYIADFTYFTKESEEYPDGQFVVVDVKGGNQNKVVVSPEAKLKLNWMNAEYGIDVQIIGR